MQKLILGTGTAIWWLTEPHCSKLGEHLGWARLGYWFLKGHNFSTRRAREELLTVFGKLVM
jgi:hypothetical protein